MKINLLYNQKNVLSGFLNLDPFCENETDNLIKHSLINLDDVCENGECTEIIAEDVIDYFSSNIVDEMLYNWISKLRHGGIIRIGGVDLNDVARKIFVKQLDLINANIILFGDQNNTSDFKKSCLSLSDIVNFLEGSNLKVIKKKINDYRYIIEAVRP